MLNEKTWVRIPKGVQEGFPNKGNPFYLSNFFLYLRYNSIILCKFADYETNLSQKLYYIPIYTGQRYFISF